MSLLRPKNTGDFDLERSAEELQARKRNWRPYYVVGAGALVFGALVYAEPHIWGSDKPSPQKRVQIQGAYDVAALGAFHHPDPPERPTIVERVEIDRPVEVPTLVEVDRPVPTPPPEIPEQRHEVERVRLDNVIAFNSQSDPRDTTMFDGTRPIEAWGCALRPGLTVIHATFNDDIRWDMGGQITATVSRDVLSPEAFATGQRRVLLPAGAQLVGTSNPETLRRGMDLAAGPVWIQASFVDTVGMPRTITLFDAQGANAAGVNGIGGDVDPRWGPILGAVGVFTALDMLSGVNVQVGNDNSTIRVDGSPAAQIGVEVVRSMLDWKPIIFTPKGTAVTIRPTKAIKAC